jgi:hypothetical protein
MKVMSEVFKLEYVDIENNLINWKAKKMLKKVVIRDFAPFQMYKFYSDFEIVDMSMWSNLFEQASNLKEHMANNNTHNEKSSITNPSNVTTTT